jgi:3-methylcrotonyl-CoA carboxylase beta subunit
MWPNARISVMGGEQAAGVLATIKRDQLENKGAQWSEEQEAEFRKPILETYQTQGHPYYASARLWDDGVIEPSQTRNVIARCMAIARNKAIEDTLFGVFRM